MTSRTKELAIFTPTEAANVLVALRFLHRKIGSWSAVSKVTGFKPRTLTNVMSRLKPPSPGMAIVAARLLEVPIDDVVNGRLKPLPEVCPHCGQIMPSEESAAG